MERPWSRLPRLKWGSVGEEVEAEGHGQTLILARAGEIGGEKIGLREDWRGREKEQVQRHTIGEAEG